MKVDDPERYLQLEHLCGRAYVDAKDIYPLEQSGGGGGGGGREKRRAQLAHSLSQEVVVVPPSRLLALVGQALKWQQGQGLLAPGTAFDLFRGTAAVARDEVEAVPSSLELRLALGAKNHAEVARFSPDGLMLVAGEGGREGGRVGWVGGWCVRGWCVRGRSSMRVAGLACSDPPPLPAQRRCGGCSGGGIGDGGN